MIHKQEIIQKKITTCRILNEVLFIIKFYFMDAPIVIKHIKGAPGLRLLGMGPNLIPLDGLNQLKTLLNENTFWSKQRGIKDIKKMLCNSSVIVSAWEGKNLIGFGRATSDNIYRAVLWDVVVEKRLQRKGIGRRIVNSITRSLSRSGVERIYLMTTHFESFYIKLGFSKENSQKLMIFKSNESN